jgi:hypothetical protein
MNFQINFLFMLYNHFKFWRKKNKTKPVKIFHWYLGLWHHSSIIISIKVIPKQKGRLINFPTNFQNKIYWFTFSKKKRKKLDISWTVDNFFSEIKNLSIISFWNNSHKGNLSYFIINKSHHREIRGYLLRLFFCILRKLCVVTWI